MKTLRAYVSRLPIRWKIMVWSTLILCVLFAAYNLAQFFAIGHWLTIQESGSMERSMAQLQDYYQTRNSELDEEQIKASESYLEKIIEKRQLIRVLDQNGAPVVTAADRLPSDWVLPETSRQSLLISVWHNDEHLLVLRSPLLTAHFRGTIEIVNNLDTMDRLSDLILIVMIVAGVGAILLSGLGGWLLSKQLLQPIDSLSKTIRNIQRGGLHERVRPLNNNDELSRLSGQFNEMMDQLEASFAQQKQFVEDASHELRTPLAIIKGHLSLLRRWGKSDPEVLNISLDAAMQEFSRMEGIVQDLLELTRAESELPAEAMSTINPAATIRQCVERFASVHPDMAFETDVHQVESAVIQAVPHQLEQILLILLDNAVKYSSPSSTIKVTAIRLGQGVDICVTDYGIGIPEDELPFVFDRFYRVDKARSRSVGGTGLGLAIAKRLVERNQGQISIASKNREGTTVTVHFPEVKTCNK